MNTFLKFGLPCCPGYRVTVVNHRRRKYRTEAGLVFRIEMRWENLADPIFKIVVLLDRKVFIKVDPSAILTVQAPLNFSPNSNI